MYPWVRGVVGVRTIQSDWQHAETVVIIVQRQAELLQVIGALDPPGRFPRRLQQQRNQIGNDGDHHQKLHQGKAGPLFRFHRQAPLRCGARKIENVRPHGSFPLATSRYHTRLF